jgi:hypothetical protein
VHHKIKTETGNHRQLTGFWGKSPKPVKLPLPAPIWKVTQRSQLRLPNKYPFSLPSAPSPNPSKTQTVLPPVQLEMDNTRCERHTGVHPEVEITAQGHSQALDYFKVLGTQSHKDITIIIKR